MQGVSEGKNLASTGCTTVELLGDDIDRALSKAVNVRGMCEGCVNELLGPKPMSKPDLGKQAPPVGGRLSVMRDKLAVVLSALDDANEHMARLQQE